MAADLLLSLSVGLMAAGLFLGIAAAIQTVLE